jgi:tRNA-uridine 2-sulfurtransferase
MKTKVVALLSGGLDSRLAVRVLQEQGLEVEGLNFKTLFTCCQDDAAAAARDLGIRLTVVTQQDDYLELIKRPRYGYGKGANPCVDCRIYMFQRALRLMEELGAVCVASGEVLGQRPKSQKRRDLAIIGRESGLEDLLLRPLSAKLLPPTRPEREGLVDRSRLYGFSGRSRKGLIELARSFGFSEREIPTPSTGCTLTEVQFASRVHDLVQLSPDAARWDFELLKTGRHFRFDERTKVVVGRRQEENQMLEYLFGLPEASDSALVWPHDFLGPTALVVGPAEDEALDFAAALIHRYTRDPGQSPRVVVRHGGSSQLRPVRTHALAVAAATL